MNKRRIDIYIEGEGEWKKSWSAVGKALPNIHHQLNGDNLFHARDLPAFYIIIIL